jgi:hypothetical protein
VLPELKAQPAPQPVVQPVPEPSAVSEPMAETAKPAPKAARTTATRAAPVAVAPVVAAAPSVAAAAPVTAPAEAAPIASAQSAPVGQPQPLPVAARSENTAEIGMGLVGLLALGGIGAYAMSRRRRAVVNDRTVYADEPLPVAQTPRPLEPTPAAGVGQPTYAPPVSRSYTAPEGAASAAMIPPGPLPTGAAMATLFERMVNAAPDADNPFKSDKRRRARVRWLMKQHEYRLEDPDGMTEADRFAAKEGAFDFRTYKPSSTVIADEGARKEVVPA